MLGCSEAVTLEGGVMQYLRGSQPTVAGYGEAVRKAKQRMAELKEQAHSLAKAKP